MTNTDTKTVIKAKRIKYNFDLTFPDTFTLRDLRKATHYKINAITIYSRIRKAIEAGKVAEAGLRDPAKTRRGRKEIVYAKVQKPEAPVATLEVAVPSGVDW
jgi:hypothetical protein